MPLSYLAVHVRTSPEAAKKREYESEWTARLAALVRDAPADVAIYLASDTLATALPLALRVVRQSVGRARIYSHLNFSSSLSHLHTDAALAKLLLDIFAAVHAVRFSPSTRSGLSLHMMAVRECVKSQRCVPLTRGLAESSSGCGGDLPFAVELRNPSAPARTSVHASSRARS